MRTNAAFGFQRGERQILQVGEHRHVKAPAVAHLIRKMTSRLFRGELKHLCTARRNTQKRFSKTAAWQRRLSKRRVRWHITPWPAKRFR